MTKKIIRRIAYGLAAAVLTTAFGCLIWWLALTFGFPVLPITMMSIFAFAIGMTIAESGER